LSDKAAADTQRLKIFLIVKHTSEEEWYEIVDRKRERGKPYG
jgi:hypothetical protein